MASGPGEGKESNLKDGVVKKNLFIISRQSKAGILLVRGWGVTRSKSERKI